jgi:uncharacterized protein YkwD
MAFGRRFPRGSASESVAAGRSQLGILVVLVLLAFSTALTADRRSPAPVRAVLSSQDAGQQVVMLGTTSFSTTSDPWKSYLASESTCPGGERTDLGIARQTRTIACLINYARGRRGLHPLAVRRVLTDASFVKAQEIARCLRFAHNPCGGDWTTAVRSTGYRGTFGENLYLATGQWGAPLFAVDAWLNSTSHRENLFSRDWREQGLALLWKKSFGGYSDVSIWVSVMGVARATGP